MAIRVSDVEKMKDMGGIPVHVGDRVLSFNLVPDGWGRDKIRACIRGEIELPGVPATLAERDGFLYVVRDGSGTGCDPSDPKYGVRVLTPSMEPR
jgi:hypothetical protein